MGVTHLRPANRPGPGDSIRPPPVITAGGRVLYLGKRGGIWWYRCTACGGGAGYEDPNRCFEQAVIHGRKVCDQ
jgi:hypothetical protein